jgi:hypothetical protein
MGSVHKMTMTLLVLAALGGCTRVQTAAVKEPTRGEFLNIRHIIAANPQKKACVGYDAATNSCASVITYTVDGDTMTAQETAALLLAGGGGTQYIQTLTRSTIRDGQACTQADGVEVTGRDEMSEFVLDEAHSLYQQYGGSICGSYYRSGDGYLVNHVGANGQTVPPGDVNFQFILGEAKLRAQ